MLSPSNEPGCDVNITSSCDFISIDLFHNALIPFCQKRLNCLSKFRLMIKYLTLIFFDIRIFRNTCLIRWIQQKKFTKIQGLE